MQLALLCVGLTTLFYFVFVQWLAKRYNEAFSCAGLCCAAERQLSSADVFSRNVSSAHAVVERGLLSVQNAACGMGLRGAWQKGSCLLCELTAHSQISAGGKIRHIFMSGLWLEASFSVRPDTCYVLMPDSMPGARQHRFHDYELLTMQDPRFAQYRLYGKGNNTAGGRRHFLQQCSLLLQAAGHPVAVLLDENGLCAFVNGKELLCDAPIRGTISQEVLNYNRIPELATLLEIAEKYAQ